MTNNMPDEELVYRIYDPVFMKEMIETFSNQRTFKRFIIPLQYIGEIRNSSTIHFIQKQIERFYQQRNSFVHIQWYNERNILLVSEFSMESKDRTFVFPYEDYDKFMPTIKEINDCKDLGMLLFFVNNIPYSLEAGIVIASESEEALKKACTIALNSQMNRNYQLSLTEIILGLKDRQYNVVALTPKETLEDLQRAISPLLLHPSKAEYEQRGYHIKEREKPKIFVSYSHSDKTTVRTVINQLRDYGLDFWIDEEQIDVGDRLLERVDKGMRECDIPIIFISKHTKTSMFAKHELLTFFSQIIYQNSTNKKWFIIRLDEIDPNDLIQGLGDFLYIDYDKKSIEPIYHALKRKCK